MKLIFIIYITVFITLAAEPFLQVQHTEDQVKAYIQNGSFPKWLVELYPNEIQIDGHLFQQELINYQSINDSVAFCTYKMSDEVCAWQYLITHVNQIKKDSLEIENMCDHDQSSPTFYWKDCIFTSSNAFQINDYTEYVPDSFLYDDGQLTEGDDFSDTQKNVKTITKHYQVNHDGLINKIEK